MMEHANEESRMEDHQAIYDYLCKCLMVHPEVVVEYMAKRSDWAKLNVEQIRQQLEKVLADAKETNEAADTSTQGHSGAAGMSRKEHLYRRLILTEMKLLWEADRNNRKLKRELEAKTRQLQAMVEGRAMLHANALGTIRRAHANYRKTTLENQELQENLDMANEELQMLRMQVQKKWKDASRHAK